jgi:serine/threonine protein kinase
MPLTRIGPFALEEPLDGFAESNVLRGVHVERKLSMAVKLLPKSIVNRPMRSSTFADDVKTLQAMVHPCIVRYYGGAVEQGQPYLALELIEGESLRDRLDRRGRLPWELTVDVADAVCTALHHAHGRKIVHGRLTPTRILLRADDQVKVTGFDCQWADHDEVLGLRCPMAVAHYLAPEVFRGKKSAGYPTGDLFSLGVILYECLTGELPWQGDSPAELVQSRRKSPAPRVSTKVLDCPVWLDMLVAKLLEAKRQDRFPSAEETHRAIAQAKRKVAAGMGAAQQAWSGQKGSLTLDQDRSEVRRIKRRGRTRQRDTSPFYERAWFLAICLIAMVGLGVWALLPPGEEALFAKAKPLMESDSPGKWKNAEDWYLSSFRTRFPDSDHAEEIAQFDRQVAIHRAETRLNNNERLRRPPQSEAERKFGEGRSYEQFGDRLSAWKKYEAMINLFADSEDKFDRAFVELAKRQIDRIKAQHDPTENQSEFLEGQLAKARELIAKNDLFAARKILDGIDELYGNNQEARALVEQARDEKRRLDLTGGP